MKGLDFFHVVAKWKIPPRVKIYFFIYGIILTFHVLTTSVFLVPMPPPSLDAHSHFLIARLRPGIAPLAHWLNSLGKVAYQYFVISSHIANFYRPAICLWCFFSIMVVLRYRKFPPQSVNKCFLLTHALLPSPSANQVPHKEGGRGDSRGGEGGGGGSQFTEVQFEWETSDFWKKKIPVGKLGPVTRLSRFEKRRYDTRRDRSILSRDFFSQDRLKMKYPVLNKKKPSRRQKSC